MKPIVSVIIPTYRRKQSLKEALLSVCAQDEQLVEMIVVDDNGSREWNETVAQIVRDVQSSQHTLHSLRLIVNEQNLGAARSRNAGIHAAHGTYITFLDDDDIYLPSKISTQLAAMQAASADYSLMDLDLLNEKGQLIEHKTHPYLNGVLAQSELIRLHLLYHLTGTDTMMFRREYLLQIGCFGEIDIGDEFYLMMKAIENGGKFLYLPHPLVKARIHYDGSGLSGGPRKFEGEKMLFAFKQTYFPQLQRKDIRSIRMRHHAVLAFAHLRAKHPARFLLEALHSLLSSPAACCRMIYQRKLK